MNYFYLLAFANNDAVNMQVRVFIYDLFSLILGIYLGVELLGPNIVLENYTFI